jgi:polar amino acid transport system ATP-binding protein
MNPAVIVTGLSKRFGATEVLHDIDVTALAGQVTCLIGPSGSGKSTLLRCIAMLEQPTAGSLTIGSETLGPWRGGVGSALSPTRRRVIRAGIGVVFQQFNLWPHMTALGNVAEALRTVRRLPRPEAEGRAMAQLTKVGMADRAGHYPSQLSGGQQQRVAIARALALEPKLMLFDEPTSSLDPELTGEVLNVMRGLAADGISMIVVSHEIGFVASVASHIVFLDHGRVVLSGPPREVFARPRHPRLTQFLETHVDVEASRLLQ